MVGTFPKIVIIAGASSQGKTRLCQALVNLAKIQGLAVKGILSPAVFTGGEKTAILVEDASTGKQRELAHARQAGSEGEIQTGHWTFNPGSMAWGSRILAEAGECGLLVVDELGPLEFTQQKGWVEGIQAINRRQYRLGVAVVRPALLEQALVLWPEATVFTVDRSRAAVDQAREILSLADS